MITADFHIHSHFSTDSSADPEDIIRRAIKLGLRTVALTDHRDYLAAGRTFGQDFDISAYLSELDRLRDKYATRIDIITGMEIGLMPSRHRDIEKLLSERPIDFVIGSSHDTPANASYYNRAYFAGKSKQQAYTEYFSHTLDNIRAVDSFDVYGHLDYIFRYSSLFGTYKDNSLDYHDYADIIDEILTLLIFKGKGVEVNTSGYRYGLNTLHPQPDILKRYRALGGEIITVGSDAHQARDIHADFDRAEAVLKECGFTAYTVFKARKPTWVQF